MAYTTIDDPSAHFQTKIYSGDGNDDRNITFDGNSDMQPDWLWFKRRNQDVNHILFDSTRGVTKRNHTNNKNAEATEANFLQAFQSDGFQVGTDADINASGGTYVAWGWKANGGTTASNTDGGITTTVQANTTAGFSIMTYVGNNTGGGTLGHGLGAVPEWIISKSRIATKPWQCYHKSIGNDHFIDLDSTNAKVSASASWGNTTPSSSVVTLGNGDTNHTGNMIMYAWKPIQGFSKFGKYTGNGNANGPRVYTGFKPAFLIIKNTSDSNDEWILWDNQRSTLNPVDDYLGPSSSAAESANSNWAIIDFLSNGFKLRSSDISYNQNTHVYIYIAFAESPFVSSEGVPTTAR